MAQAGEVSMDGREQRREERRDKKKRAGGGDDDEVPDQGDWVFGDKRYKGPRTHKDFLAALYHYVKITVGKDEAETVDSSAINEKKKKDKKKAEAHPNSTDPDDVEHSAPRGSPGVPPPVPQSYDGVSGTLHTSALRNTSGLSSSSVATTAASDDAGVPAPAAAAAPTTPTDAAFAARMPAVSTTAAGVQSLRTFSVSAGAAGSGRGTLAATARASGGLGRGRAKAVSEPPTPTVTFGSLRGGGGGSAPPTPTVRVVEARDPRPGLHAGPRKPSFSLPNSPDPFSGSHQSVSKQQQLAKDILGALNRTAAADRDKGGSDSAPDGGDGPVRPAAAPTSPQLGPAASASRVKEITDILSASASSGPARGIVVEGGSVEVGPLSAVHGGRARRGVTMLNRVLASGLHGVSFPAAAGCRFGYSVSLGGEGAQLSVVFTCVGRLSFSRHLSLSLSAPVAAVEWRRDIPTSFLAAEAVAGLVGQGWSAKVLGATRLHEMTYLRLTLEDGGGSSGGVDDGEEDGLHQDLLFAPSPYGAVSVVMGDGERTATHFLCPVQDLLRHEPVRRPASVPGTPTLQPQQAQ